MPTTLPQTTAGTRQKILPEKRARLGGGLTVVFRLAGANGIVISTPHLVAREGIDVEVVPVEMALAILLRHEHLLELYS